MTPGPPTIGLDARKAADFGIGTYTRELIAAIAANPDSARYRFVVFLRPKDRALLPELPGHFSIETADFSGYSLSELTTFASQVRRRRLSLFHALHYVLPPFLGTPSVVTIHDLIHLHRELAPRAGAAPYARFMIGRAVSRARSLVTGSEAMRREIEARFPRAAGKTSVIAHGVSSEFRPGADREGKIATKYDLPARYALFLGGERPHKNLRRVLEAFEIASRADPDLGLVLAGPLPDRSAVTGRISQAGLDRRVRIVGVVPQEDLPGLYAGALALVYPTLAEGFGLPALEAMASGAPVVASAIPVWRETCGDAAILVDPRDPAAIARALLRLAGSDSERERLRRLGRERAAAFPWTAAAEKTLRVYSKAL